MGKYHLPVHTEYKDGPKCHFKIGHVITETSKQLAFYCTLGCVLCFVILFFRFINIIQIIESNLDGNDNRVYLKRQCDIIQKY